MIVSEEEQDDLVRQGERTIDNLKRLVAVIFAISFGAAGLAMIDKFVGAIRDGAPIFVDLKTLAVNTEMFIVFMVTAAIFYHQATKFLDHRYARKPLSVATKIGFAWDLFSIILTMVPFYFMANSFRGEVTGTIGYTMYFFSYVALLYLGLILLMISEVRHHLHTSGLSEGEVERDSRLRYFWFSMNTTALLICVIGFSVFQSVSKACPTSQNSYAFLYLFGAIALIRDAVDYSCAWRFIYPLPAEIIRKPQGAVVGFLSTRFGSALIGGAAFTVLSYMIFGHLQLHDIDHWVTACRVSRP